MSDSKAPGAPNNGASSEESEGKSSAAGPDNPSSQGWMEKVRQLFLGSNPPSLQQVMEDVLSDNPSSVSVEEQSLILRTLRFGSLRVEDVMVPRADVIAIDETAPLSELYALFVSAGHSRIPVYQETLDDPRGMVHVKDFMKLIAIEAAPTTKTGKKARKPEDERETSTATGEAATGSTKTAQSVAQANNDNKQGTPEINFTNLGSVDLSKSIAQSKLTRNVLYVPPSMPVMNLLVRMQTTHVHLALVVDEYGGTDGIVSIEDLVEEIVGEIEDEHDADAEALLSEDARQGMVASARLPIEVLEDRLNIQLVEDDEDDVDTLGGLVFYLADRVPLRGELIRHSSGLEFEILDADPRRIKSLRIHGVDKLNTDQPTKLPASRATASPQQAEHTDTETTAPEAQPGSLSADQKLGRVAGAGTK